MPPIDAETEEKAGEIKFEDPDEEGSAEALEAELVSYPADFTLKVLADKWANQEIEIPDWQRLYVWDQPRASRLVESFLLGFPVPPVFMYRKRRSQKLLVIDGQQRIMTIVFFFKGVFNEGPRFHLRGVSDKWEGKTITELPEPDRIRFSDAVLRAIIIQEISEGSHKNLYQVFERLNTGGTPLTNQEVRNALYQGPFNTLIKELNKTPTWRKLFGTTSPDNRQRDVEMVLRVLALFHNSANYEKPMTRYLMDFMEKHQEADSSFLERSKSIFLEATERIYRALGPKPFHIAAGLNRAVLDSLYFGVCKNPTLSEEGIRTGYRNLIGDNVYLGLVGYATTDADRVKRRLELALENLR